MLEKGGGIINWLTQKVGGKLRKIGRILFDSPFLGFLKQQLMIHLARNGPIFAQFSQFVFVSLTLTSLQTIRIQTLA